MTLGRRVARGFGGVARGSGPAILALLATVAAQAKQVTFDRILHADREPQNWLTYSGSLFSHRHSLLTQITPSNVKNLELQWVFQTRGPAEPVEKFEATPLVVDGVMYTVLAPNHVVALDAATGRMLWMYSPRLRRRVRREDRKGSLALRHRSGARRGWTRDVAAEQRCMGAWRRVHLGDWFL